MVNTPFSSYFIHSDLRWVHTNIVATSYFIAENVIYLVIAEKSYPRKLAFSYLDELSKEFQTSYGAKVDGVRKPYAFVGFGKLRRLLSAEDARDDRFLCLRYVYVKDHTIVSRHKDRKRSGGATSGQAERRAAGRYANHDEEHGGASMERGLP